MKWDNLCWKMILW